MAPELREHGTAEASTSNPMSQAGNMTPGSQEHSAVESCAGSQIADMWLSSLERPARRSSGRRIQSTAQAPLQSNLDEKRQSMLQRAITLEDHWRSLQERCAERGVGGWQAHNLDMFKGIIDQNKQDLKNMGDEGGDINDRRLDQINRQLVNLEKDIINKKKLKSHLARATDFLGRLKLLKNQFSIRGDNNGILDGIDSNIKDLEGILNDLTAVDADGIDYDGSHGDAIAYFNSVTASLETMLRRPEPGYYDYMQPALGAVLKDGYSSSRRKAVGDPGMQGGDSDGIS
ncbi:hypothetical protein XpopCFBP1817_06560 [Xanthomonas populi]|uniref:Uncharacterized protein n=1 Tax=Xanthomonas populi TaxID=53414 RepID=A0A2S7ETK1_9XANT|nr:hypothetical protein [Xanthomonas populi]PPU96478.1 hypothetical protein XpopCFBP1817_06560 [Xanthomonas populi]